jgi:chromosome segregation ATPase
MKIQELTNTVEQLKQELASQAARLDGKKSKLKDVKEILAKEAAAARNNENVIEKLKMEVKGLRDEQGQMQQLREAEREKYLLLKSKTREAYETIERLRQQETDLRTELLRVEEEKEKNREKIFEMESQQKQWELVARFVHRITDEEPVPSEQLAALLEE